MGEGWGTQKLGTFRDAGIRLAKPQDPRKRVWRLAAVSRVGEGLVDEPGHPSRP